MDALRWIERLAPQVRRTVGVAVSIGGFVALMLGKSVLPEGIAESWLTAWGLVTGWLCGIRWGLVITLAAATCDWLATAPEHVAAMIGIMLRWGTTVLLVLWTAWLQDRLKTEYRRARLDPLTGLPNRQAFFERCTAELSRAKRFHRPLTVMLLDGDDFKTVNDRHGHAAGDRALQQTARTLVTGVRPYDLVCRLGGDEFVLLFPETSGADAARIAVRLQTVLRSVIEDAFPPLSYSIGVVTFSPPVPQNPDLCLAEADRALYAAKRAGKNSVHYATPADDQPV